MKKNILKILPFLIGAILGATVFIALFGVNIILPTNTDWIFAHPDDVTQHHIGWVYFRNTPWTFPICMTEGLTSNGQVSCMYTDSLPLFAIFFKILSPILPETFQYFGIWGIVCFALNGGFGAVLISRLNKNLIFISAGSLFYSVFFPSVLRITHHNSLGAIWLIMLAIILTLDYKREYRFRFTPVILWSLICVLASLIHSYFTPMIYIVMLGYMILLVFSRKKLLQAVITFASSTAATLLSMWIIGAFHGSGNYSDSGFGIYSSNFNTFFNSMGRSKYLRQLNSFDGQGEGFGYLGLGMLVCCFLALIIAVSRFGRKEGAFFRNIIAYIRSHRVEFIAFICVFSVGFLWAASTKLTLNQHVILDIKLPAFIMGKLAVFRASGRFIWVPCIIVMTTALWLVSKLDKRSAAASVIICAWLQVNDIRSLRNDLRREYVNPISTTQNITDSEWENISEGIEEIVFLPLPPNYQSYMQLYFDFAHHASEDNIKLSSFYLARSEYGSLASYADSQYELLSSGNGRADALYVFFKEEDIPKEADNLKIHRIGDYITARVKS